MYLNLVMDVMPDSLFQLLRHRLLEGQRLPISIVKVNDLDMYSRSSRHTPTWRLPLA